MYYTIALLYHFRTLILLLLVPVIEITAGNWWKPMRKPKRPVKWFQNLRKKTDEKSVKNQKKFPSYHGNNWFSKISEWQYCDSTQWWTAVWKSNSPHNMDC